MFYVPFPSISSRLFIAVFLEISLNGKLFEGFDKLISHIIFSPCIFLHFFIPSLRLSIWLYCRGGLFISSFLLFFSEFFVKKTSVLCITSKWHGRKRKIGKISSTNWWMKRSRNNTQDGTLKRRKKKKREIHYCIMCFKRGGSRYGNEVRLFWMKNSFVKI